MAHSHPISISNSRRGEQERRRPRSIRWNSDWLFDRQRVTREGGKKKKNEKWTHRESFFFFFFSLKERGHHILLYFKSIYQEYAAPDVIVPLLPRSLFHRTTNRHLSRILRNVSRFISPPFPSFPRSFLRKGHDNPLISPSSPPYHRNQSTLYATYTRVSIHRPLN